jgi:nucleoid DNA-binding protein
MKQNKAREKMDSEADNDSLTKRALVVQIAKDLDLPQQVVYDVVQMTLDGITDALLDGKHVEFRDFGVFEITTRKSRIGRNPRKPQDVFTIPQRQVVKFKPGRRMKQIAQ